MSVWSAPESRVFKHVDVIAAVYALVSFWLVKWSLSK